MLCLLLLRLLAAFFRGRQTQSEPHGLTRQLPINISVAVYQPYLDYFYYNLRNAASKTVTSQRFQTYVQPYTTQFLGLTVIE